MIPAFDINLCRLHQLPVLGLPLLFLIAIALTLLAALIVTKTRFGRHVQAVGGDERAAARAGISVERIRYVRADAQRARRRDRRHPLCRPARQRRERHRLRPRVPGLCGADDRRLLDPPRRRRQSDRRRARASWLSPGVANILDLQAISPYYVNIIVGLLLLAAVLLDRIRGGDAYE